MRTSCDTTVRAAFVERIAGHISDFDKRALADIKGLINPNNLPKK